MYTIRYKRRGIAGKLFGANLLSRSTKRKSGALPKRVMLVLMGGLFVASGMMATYGPVLAAANITGVVYNDFNGNGIRDNADGTTPNLAADNGVSGVTVRAFDAGGNNCATTTTAADGTYTLAMGPCSGTEFRVEFSSLPAGTEPAPVGGQNNTTTQFVAEGGTADLGIAPLGSFCQNNPVVVTSCYAFGERGMDPTIRGYRYAATDTEPYAINLADWDEVGAVHGMAFRKADRTVYGSAFTKRHVGLGPGGIGAIYAMGPVPADSTGSLTASHFATIPNAGVDRHPVSTTNCDGRDGTPGGTAPGGEDCWSWDQFMFDAPGKAGLGDMELYEDPYNAANDALLVVNLNDRSLYRVTDLDGTPTVSAPIAMPIALPGAAQGCAAADVRPFALEIHNGTGYAGLTCSAETSGSQSDLRAYVYTFDPVSGTFGASPILEVPLDYERGCVQGCWQQPDPFIADWNPWTSTFSFPPIIQEENPGFATRMVYPSPLLSDIVIGTNGSMTLALRDRFGDQTSYHSGYNTTLGDTQAYSTTTAGEILRACLVGSTWTLENAGTCDGMGPGPAGVKSSEPSRGQGPGGFEFYNWEFYDDGSGDSTSIDESSSASIAAIPGFNEIISTTMDPLVDGSSSLVGTRIYNTNTGGRVAAHEILPSEHDLFKTNPLGDLEVLCDLAPVEIGNRVWFDANQNGVQDPEEPPIPGVTVNLYDTDDNPIGTVVTDDNGDYLFSNRCMDEDGNPLASSPGKEYCVAGLTPNTTGYQLRLDNPDDYTDPAKLEGLFLTLADSTQDNGNNQNDSKATLPDAEEMPSDTNAPIITFAVGPAGANNHTYDFGFTLSAVTPPSPPGPSPGPDDNTPSAGGGLASTGSNMLWLIVTGATLIAGAGGTYYYFRRHATYARSY